MFNLITVAIGIVLVLALSIAGIFYGGQVFMEKRADSLFAELMNKASQIRGAMEFYRSKHGVWPQADTSTDLLDDLVTEGYLMAIPEGDWRVTNLVIFRPIDDGSICERVNRLAGYPVDSISEGCPACDDAAYSAWPACQR